MVATWDTSTMTDLNQDNLSQKVKNARQALNARNYRIRKKKQFENAEKIIKDLEIKNLKYTQRISKLEQILFLLRFHFFDICIKNMLRQNNQNYNDLIDLKSNREF